MNYSLTVLTCGRNATGLSAIFGVQRDHHSSMESTTLSSCLLNVGDTTQRFCGENRIKLSRVHCIVITSLAPHNVSGLPGILLCLSSLGVGALTVIGPPGLQGLLDSMTIITNKRYPELTVVEVGTPMAQGGHNHDVIVKLEYMTVFVRPVFVEQMSHDTAAIAIAVVIIPKQAAEVSNLFVSKYCKPMSILPFPGRSSDGSGNVLRYTATTTQSNKIELTVGIAVLPIETCGRGMFLTKPSLNGLSAWAASSSFSTVPTFSTTPPDPQYLSQPVALCLFVPISVTSIALSQRCSMLSVSSIISSSSALNEAAQSAITTKKKVRICCRNFNLAGIFFDARLDSDFCELRQAQETLSVLRSVYVPLFPRPLTGLRSEIESVEKLVDEVEGQDESDISAIDAVDNYADNNDKEPFNDGRNYQDQSSSTDAIRSTVDSNTLRAGVEENIESVYVVHQGNVYDSIPMMRVQLSLPLSHSLLYPISDQLLDMEDHGEELGEDCSEEDDSSSEEESSEGESSEEESSEEESSEEESCEEESSEEKRTEEKSSESSSKIEDNKKDNIETVRSEGFNVDSNVPAILKNIGSLTSAMLTNDEISCTYEGNDIKVGSAWKEVQADVTTDNNKNNNNNKGKFLCFKSSHTLRTMALEVVSKIALVNLQYDKSSTIHPSSNTISYALPAHSNSVLGKCDFNRYLHSNEHKETNVQQSRSILKDVFIGREKIKTDFNSQNLTAASDLRLQLLNRGRKRSLQNSSEKPHQRQGGFLTSSENSHESEATDALLCDVHNGYPTGDGPTETDNHSMLGADPSSSTISRENVCTETIDCRTGIAVRISAYDSLPVLSSTLPTSSSILTSSLSLSSSFPSSSFSTPISVPHMPPPHPLDVTITFLGTGSATPSKHRNNSCILLSIPMIPSFSPPYPPPRPLASSLTPIVMSHESVVQAKQVLLENGQKEGQKEAQEQKEKQQQEQEQQKNIVLLDVGEGTCTQLFQSVGGDIDRFNSALLSIRLIWISHHHADHVCGLPLLLEHVNRAAVLRGKVLSAIIEKDKNLDKSNTLSSSSSSASAVTAAAASIVAHKITVIGPPVVLKYQEYCACVAGLDDLVVFVPTVATLFASYSVPLPQSPSLLGMCTTRLLVRSVQVPHCKESYGLILEIQRNDNNHRSNDNTRNMKIVYSGDCRPSTSLINAGKECDLLLHEATFDDTMQSDAECKRHCTTSEAVEVGVRMRAKHIVLTHFSQRYPTVVQSFLNFPNTEIGTQKNDGIRSGNDSVSKRSFSVAFDLLRFSFPSQIKHLPLATSALAQILSAAANSSSAVSNVEVQED